jgi:hypothetical protein
MGDVSLAAPGSAAVADAESDAVNAAVAGRDTRARGVTVTTPLWTDSTPNDASPMVSNHRPHASPALPVSMERGKGRSETIVAAGGEAAQQKQNLTASAADLLVSFLPFDRARVERAFDQVLGRLDELETALSRLGTTANLIPGLAAMAVTIGVAEFFHRRFRHRLAGDRRGTSGVEASASAGRSGADADGDAVFPGLPGSPHQFGLEVR